MALKVIFLQIIIVFLKIVWYIISIIQSHVDSDIITVKGEIFFNE